jgi:hypothetical protein
MKVVRLEKGCKQSVMWNIKMENSRIVMDKIYWLSKHILLYLIILSETILTATCLIVKFSFYNLKNEKTPTMSTYRYVFLPILIK